MFCTEVTCHGWPHLCFSLKLRVMADPFCVLHGSYVSWQTRFVFCTEVMWLADPFVFVCFFMEVTCCWLTPFVFCTEVCHGWPLLWSATCHGRPVFVILPGGYVSWLTRFVIFPEVTCHGWPVLWSSRRLRVMADPFCDLPGGYVSWLTRFVICPEVTCHGRPVLWSAWTLRVMADPSCDLHGRYVSWQTRFVICTEVTCHGRPVLWSARRLRVVDSATITWRRWFSVGKCGVVGLGKRHECIIDGEWRSGLMSKSRGMRPSCESVGFSRLSLWDSSTSVANQAPADLVLGHTSLWWTGRRRRCCCCCAAAVFIHLKSVCCPF